MCSFSAYKITYIYLRHPPLSMNQSQYGVEHALENAVGIVALLVIVPIARKVFNVRDSLLIIGSTISRALFLLMMGLSRVTWLIYICK